MQELDDALVQKISGNNFKERDLSLKVDGRYLDLVTDLAEALKKNNTIERVTLECNLSDIPNSNGRDYFSQFAPDIRDDLQGRLSDVLRVNNTISVLCLKYTRGGHWLEEKYGRLIQK